MKNFFSRVKRAMKRSPLKRKTQLRRGPGFAKKPRTGLRKVSARRRRELKEYSERRASFLAMPENQWCAVWDAISPCPVCGKPEVETEISRAGKWGPPLMCCAFGRKDKPRKMTTDIHHKAGREGKLLNDERHWLAVSRAGHDFIHQNPGIARAHGWLI